VRQVTGHPSIHHHPFYYLPAYDDSMHYLFFVSHRTGCPQIFAEIRQTTELIQLTDRTDLNEWSIHPSHGGHFVYFTAGNGAWRVNLATLEEQCLADLGCNRLGHRGAVGDALGTTSLSRDDRWWAVPVRGKASVRLIVIDTASGALQEILERPALCHPQFHPDDANQLHYSGPYDQRIWIIRRDGSDLRLVYQRNEARKQWIVHETWMPGRCEILTVDWPHGVLGIDVDTGRTRHVARFNAWHPMVNRDGTLMVTDTNYPDIGIQLFDPRDGIGKPRLLCHSHASSRGDHWQTDHCPYDDGPVDVYAPQHTHPHPSFSPDNRRIVYTSDCTGHSQIYEVELGTGFA
jgi:oligogalacturonide lyase